MRHIVIISALFILLASCQKEKALSLEHTNSNKTIAIQPLDSYDEQQLQFLQRDLQTLFHTRVIVLKPVYIPAPTEGANNRQYPADSLLQFLLQFRKGSIVEVIGLTHKDIYITSHNRDYNYPITKSFAYKHSIRGLGYISENACIVSDYRLASTNKGLWNNRLRKAVLHELGHNMGLSHCADDTCIMSEKNGDIVVLDKYGGSFCKQCRQRQE